MSAPSARAAELLVAGLLAALVCLFFYEVAFLGRTFLPLGIGYGGVMGGAGPWELTAPPRPDPYRWDRGASSWQIEPHARAIGAAYAEGRLPLWNPHQGLGAPLAANAQSGAFDPLRLPLFASSSPLAWDAYYLARCWLALLLAYLFARRVGLAVAAAITLAASYVLSGFMLSLSNNHYLEVYFLLPGLLWGTDLLLGGRARGGLLVLAVAVAASTLAGMPEVTLLTFLYAASYGAYRLALLALARGKPDRQAPAVAPPFYCPAPAGGWRPVARSAALLGLGWLLGLGLAAPLIFPLEEYLRESFHIHTPDIKLGVAYQPLSRLALIAVPYLQGLPARGVLDGPPPGVAPYFSAAGVLLASLGLLASRRSALAPLGGFAAGSLLLWGGKLFGAPGINELGWLPLLNLTLVKDWGVPLVTFSLALLAGLGVHAASRGALAPPVLAASLALFGLCLVLSVALNWPLVQAAGTEHLLATLGLATGAGLATWGVLLAGRRRPGAWLGAACCALVVGELFLLAPKGIYQVRHDPLARPPFVAFLQSQRQAGQPFRVFALGGLLHPNLATGFGLDDLRVLDALYPRRFFEYVRTFITPIFDRYLGVPRGRQEGETRIGDNPWLDLANVRFVIVPPGTPLPEAAARQLRRVYAGEVEVLERPTAFPRAFLVARAIGVPDMPSAIAAMQRPGFDPAAFAVVEGLPPTAPLAPEEAPSHEPPIAEPGEVQVVAYAADRVELRLRAPRRSVLVLADVYYPGWKAFVDGVEAPIYPTDLAFRGVAVEAGAHRVVFRYQPASFALGAAVAGLALAALTVALAWPLGRGHRAAGPAPPAP